MCTSEESTTWLAIFASAHRRNRIPVEGANGAYDPRATYRQGTVGRDQSRARGIAAGARGLRSDVSQHRRSAALSAGIDQCLALDRKLVGDGSGGRSADAASTSVTASTPVPIGSISPLGAGIRCALIFCLGDQREEAEYQYL